MAPILPVWTFRTEPNHCIAILSVDFGVKNLFLFKKGDVSLDVILIRLIEKVSRDGLK